MALQSESRARDRMLRIVQEVLGAGSENDTFYFCLHPVGQHSGTWPQLSAREPGKRGFSVWRRRKLNTECVSAAGDQKGPSYSLLTFPGSLYPLEKKMHFSFDLWAFHEGMALCHQSGFVKDHFFFLISAGSCNLLFNLANLSQPNHFFIYSPRIPSLYSHHCWENSGYLKWITQFFPPCPNYLFLVHNSLPLIISLSHEDVWWLHVPQALSLEGDLLIIKGKVINESPRDPPLWTEIWCEGLFY